MTTLTQRITGIVVLTLFLLSVVPFALAERNSGTGLVVEILEDSEVENDNDGSKVRSEKRVKVESDDLRSEVRERVKVKVEESKGKTSTKEEHRERARQRVKELKEKYEELKEKHKKAKDRYEEEKEELQELKEKAGRCKEDSGECKSRKLELKKGVKQHLLKTNDLITSSLERLISRVQNSKVLTEEQKQEALAKFEELEVELSTKQQEVQALAENATNEELRVAVKELKETWKNVRKEQKKIISSLISGKVDEVAGKHQRFGRSMEARIAELKVLGVDTTELETIHLQFVAKMEELAQARVALKAGTGSLDDVKRIMQESRQILRNFVTKYKELKPSEEGEQEEDEGNTTTPGNTTAPEVPETPENETGTSPDNSTTPGNETGTPEGTQPGNESNESAGTTDAAVVG